MDFKETLSRTSDTHRVVEDSNYYKYIFKKTEKIACAVFYILRSDTEQIHKDTVADDLEDTALMVLDVSLDALKGTSATIGTKVSDLRFALIGLESRLRVAHAARHLSTDILTVFLHEIDSVYRAMKKYGDVSVHTLLSDVEEHNTAHRIERPARIKQAPKPVGDASAPAVPRGMSRRDRVLEVLRDNPSATIKDITAAITDCSEKTIQRELASLISDNLVVREGERRWSKYSLI